jgi:hypothetical protein
VVGVVRRYSHASSRNGKSIWALSINLVKPINSSHSSM